MKKVFSYIGLAILMVLMTSVLTAAASTPDVKFKLVQGLPETMELGDTATVVVEVTSKTPFLYAQALPTAFFPGRGVVAAKGDHVGAGQKAQLEVTFTAKDSTDDFAQAPGYAPVSVVVGVRFAGGYVISERYDFTVVVP